MRDSCVELAHAAAYCDVDHAERRKRSRIRVRWRVDLLAVGEDGAVQTVTRDLSSCGFYCWSRVPFVPDERIVGILKAPGHNPERPECTLSLECQVRIVRVEPANQDGFYGLGCEISGYTLSRS